jgi:lambda family phage portal protein
MAWYWPFSGKKQPTSSRTYRSYNGAAFSRLLDDWIASSTSADAESRTAIRTLRNRVRELGRNNDYVVNALRSIQNNVIGNGVKLQAQIKRKRGPGAGDLDDTLNDAIEDAWEFWKRAANCHVAGVLSFSEIERLVARTVASDGEVFVRLVRQKFGSSRIPLALEIIEADLLDENYNGEAPSGNQIRMGVEVDKWFRPVAYHFFTQHPGDIQFGSVGAMEQKRIRVPANEVIHVFRMDRTGQTRGVPWFASAMTRLRHMSGYEEAEVIAARASACYMGFIQTPDPQFEGDMVFEGERTAGFEPGKIQTLAPGEEFKEYNPNRPSGLLDPFMRYMLRGVAAGVGVSYEGLSKDYSQSNYSSSRLAILDERDTWRALQQWLISVLHQRVFEAWLEMATLANVLTLPGFEANPETYLTSIRWIARGWNWIDPAREIAAYKTAVRSGFMTLTDVVAQNGGDIEELFDTRARELDTCDKLELIFDTDPELTTEQGQAQTTPIEDDTGEDTKSGGSSKGDAQDVVAS